MILATFNASTGWAGRIIHYDDGQFTLDEFGQITREALLDYDQKGQLDWAYDGLREWVQGESPTRPTPALTTFAAPAMAAPAPKKRRRRWPWIVLGVVVGFIALSMIVEYILNPTNPAGTTAATTPLATAKPTVKATQTAVDTPTPKPAAFGIGDAIRIGSGKDQVSVKLVSLRRTPRVGWLLTESYGNGWDFAVLKLLFKNTGSKYYHSHVSNWSWLEVAKNPDSMVEAEGSENTLTNVDYQGGKTLEELGQLQLDSGGHKTWYVAFKVRKVAKAVAFTYQGPQNQKVTWMLAGTP